MKAKFDLKFLRRPVTLNNFEIWFGFRIIYPTNPQLAGANNAEKNDLVKNKTIANKYAINDENKSNFMKQWLNFTPD